MLVGDVRVRVKEWMTAHRSDWPDLIAAHYVGGIAAFDDLAEYSPLKDVDLHLILPDESPLLIPSGPFPSILEVAHDGVLIEAGLKPVSAYASPEVVLANPEIAQHLLVPSTIIDPNGMLERLRPEVLRQFSERRWVQARVDHEQRELEATVAMTPMASQMFGPAGELMLLGYGITFMTAALQLASLRPLQMGGKTTVHLRTVLTGHGELPLYEDILAMLGCTGITPEQAEAWLEVAANAFDQAVAVHRTRIPFDHKIRSHLRDHFVVSAGEMIAARDHREAFAWIQPYLLCTTGILLADGSDEQRQWATQVQARLLDQTGFGTDEMRAERHARAEGVRSRVFALTDRIMASNPDISN